MSAPKASETYLCVRWRQVSIAEFQSVDMMWQENGCVAPMLPWILLAPMMLPTVTAKGISI